MRACGRAHDMILAWTNFDLIVGCLSVRACGRAGVDKNEFKRGVISVRAWSIKRAGVEWQSYKARLLYNVYLLIRL